MTSKHGPRPSIGKTPRASAPRRPKNDDPPAEAPQETDAAAERGPTFESFALKPEVLSVLKELGYEEPTPIQRETIPSLLAGRDVLGQAATGTGKTAAFALPMLEKIERGATAPFTPQALVLVPTRELAMQVAEAVGKYGRKLGVSALPVFGGQEFFHQVKPLKRGVDVVVATPGRALDHLRRKTLIFSAVRFVVLDEADEMLDMGFAEDLEAILSQLPRKRQTALFSATLPSRIATIAETHLEDPVRVVIAARSVETGTLPNIRQVAYVVPRHLKEAALVRVLEAEQPQSAILFCRTRVEVEDLTAALAGHGYHAATLHGGMTQEQRDAVLKRLKAGQLRMLVATDVAARGLHVENLTHVVNFDLPVSPEPYVHRIGRTGRAGREGVALSFLEPRELRLLKNIERVTKRAIPRRPVPSSAELNELRQAALAKVVEATLELGAHGRMGALVDKLAEKYTPDNVAAAALAVLQEKLFPRHATDEMEFPAYDEKPARPHQFPEKGRRGEGERPQRHERPQRDERPRRDERPPRDERPRRDERPPRDERPRFAPEGERRPARRLTMPSTYLFISLGEKAGVRPQDLVGAIANEAGIPSKNIGEIFIGEENARVEVPTADAQAIIEALRKTKIRGRRFAVDVHRFQQHGAGTTGVERAPRDESGKKPYRRFGKPGRPHGS